MIKFQNSFDILISVPIWTVSKVPPKMLKDTKKKVSLKLSKLPLSAYVSISAESQLGLILRLNPFGIT